MLVKWRVCVAFKQEKNDRFESKGMKLCFLSSFRKNGKFLGGKLREKGGWESNWINQLLPILT